MAEAPADRWSRWLLDERFGGDETALEKALEILGPIRDRVLASAGIKPGSLVADVGCGDGLLGFGAVSQVGEDGRVVFVDISAQLLNRCRHIAAELGVVERCRFVRASAETLEGIGDGAVDVVMTRSVLIYVEDKPAAFSAFHRVLRPGGRVSVFEPINRRYAALNRRTLFGYDTTPISDLAEKIHQVFAHACPDDGPMMGFDETDLLHLAEDAGFSDVNVTLELTTTERPPHQGAAWAQLMKTAPNPNAPTYGEAIQQTLTDQEASRLEQYLRPLVDQGQAGRHRNAHAYLTAVRPAT